MNARISRLRAGASLVTMAREGATKMQRRQFLIAGMAASMVRPARADGAHALVAVATNFSKVAEGLLPAFTAETGHRVRLSSGSTGQLYGQISNGAPMMPFWPPIRRAPSVWKTRG